MTFGEKVRKARLDRGITQRELARECGLALRTVCSYENGERMPQKEETYGRLARALDITEESLRDKDAEFVAASERKYGGKGHRQAEELIRSFRVAAAGGEFDDDDLEFIKDAMMQTYMDAKNYNRRFVNRRYAKKDKTDESRSVQKPEQPKEGTEK